MTQVATALNEFEKSGYILQDLKCANVVVDDSDDVRIIDLENAGGTRGWAHQDDLIGKISQKATEKSSRTKEFVIYGFGKMVWELYVGGTPTDDEELAKTPRWVQDLVFRCLNNMFRSIEEVGQYLISIK